MDIKEIMRALTGLSPSELQQIKARCTALLQFSVPVETPAQKGNGPVDHEDWLFEGILYELKRRGITTGSRNPLSLAPHFKRDSEAVRAQLMRNYGGSLSLTKRRQYGIIAARALADYLEPVTPGVTAKRMFVEVSKVPEALDASFPDYTVSGVLPVLLAAGDKLTGLENGR